MYLKRLELIGFKSFASKTVLEFDRGITAVVGPNGSGKSNLVDAIRWALGEQSLRAVRSRKSEEVIFAGNSRRPALGMAEVTLVFDNSDGALPLPFAEVSITRRQYRSGEGEYLINRSRARLKDVVELLTHASLGPDSYAVVGQGAVDEVLLQRAEERRLLVEAAADISRHQIKLKESLDKLAETETNLRRVEDIRGEIAPRLARLRTQAQKAQRYEQLSRRLREMVRWRYLLEIRRAREAAADDLRQEVALSEMVAEMVRAQEGTREVSGRLRELLRDEEQAMEAARERLNVLQLARARSEREAALLREREAAYRREIGEVEAELAAARKERADLEAELRALESQRAELVQREADARARAAPAESERQRALSELRFIQAQLDRTVSEHQAAAAKGTELKERRSHIEREIRKAEGVRGESVKAVEEARERLAELERESARVQAELDLLRESLSALEGRRGELQARLEELARDLERARAEERRCWEQDNDLAHRLSMLRSLKEEHSGVPSGAKALLEARFPGIRGTLSSMIRVPEEFIPAVGAALGGAQGYVVSDGFREGLEALQFLTSRKGRATIAPLRLDGVGSPEKLAEDLRGRVKTLAEGLAFHGLASDLVSCSEEARGLVARYLGLSLVVEEMSDALELYRRLFELTNGRVPFQVVTRDGQLLRARGDLCSSRNGEKDGSLLAREAELVSVSEAAERAHARLADARARVAELEAARDELSRAAEAVAGEAAGVRKQIERHAGVLGELASQLAKQEAAIEWHCSRAAAADEEISQASRRLERTEHERSAAEARERELRDRADQLREDLSAQQATVAEINARLSRSQTEISSTQSRLREVGARESALSDALKRVGERERRQEERLAHLQASLARLSEGVEIGFPASMQQELEATERLLAERSRLVSQRREEYGAAEAERSSLAEKLEAARQQLSEVRARGQRGAVQLLALVREAANDAGLQIDRAEMEPDSSPDGLLGVADRVLDELDRSLAEMPVDGFPETLAATAQKEEALRRELQSLGTINAEAPEEYRQLSERHAFLTSQVEDLTQAGRTLRKAVEELRQVMERRFQETFDLVNSEFSRCFSTLFGGGSARLQLTQPERPLEGGVEVVAVPPGKKGGSLLGLSGGERALTAVALLFALMRVNPSPFCLLDEVDAALDESNVKRFCDMLEGMTESTQFVIITHNRTSMEAADVLYGVSMNADSTSRVISLRLESKENQG